jgi:hypothetical protein
MQRRRQTAAAIIAVLVIVVVATTVGIVSANTSSAPTTTTSTTTAGLGDSDPYAATEASKVAEAERRVDVVLPTTTGAPAPTLGARPFGAGLGSMQVVGFVPWYELTNTQQESLSGFTYLVYSSLDISRTAGLLERPGVDGWSSLVNGGASGLVSAGHAGGDRVLLSLFAQAESVVGPITAQPVSSGRHLAAAVAPLLSQYGFDGVDLDIEGHNTGDRAGFTRFVESFSRALSRLDSSWALMVNTYPQSAEDVTSFFDPKAVAPYVDALFVMGYDMNSTEVTSANAPLTGSDPSDARALAAYVADGLARKTILGLPFYGFDFPAAGPHPGTATTGTPYAVTYSQVATSFVVNHHKPVWDAATATPFTAFKRYGQWHQTWFDDPTSVALKVALASSFRVAGVGAWELGMTQDQPEMAALLDGGSPAKKFALARQP